MESKIKPIRVGISAENQAGSGVGAWTVAYFSQDDKGPLHHLRLTILGQGKDPQRCDIHFCSIAKSPPTPSVRPQACPDDCKEIIPTTSDQIAVLVSIGCLQPSFIPVIHMEDEIGKNVLLVLQSHNSNVPSIV